MRIDGHTDNLGDPQLNLRLSEQRAESVKSELVKRGLPSSRLEVQGFGETQPMSPNDTKAGRAKNRRVEFIVKE